MYREYPANPALAPVVCCRWLHGAQQPSVGRVVPDACMDLLWIGESLTVAGPDTAPVSVHLAASTQIVAVRFAPGTGSAVLGVPASALCDARVPLTELWGDAAHALEARLREADGVGSTWALLEAAVAQHAGTLDPLMLALVRALQPTAAGALAGLTGEHERICAPAPSVAQLARAAGVSERQLLRRARNAFGYGPKLLARILRFQAFRGALRDRPDAGLAELALALGYADQAHLTHEVSELAGVPPSQLKRELQAEPASDFDKTATAGRAHSDGHERDSNRTAQAR